MDGRRQRADRPFRDEQAVSEVLGVIMLLAMVMTIMAGVIAFLQPYLTDFEDNVNWKSANGIADRLDDRLAVAGASPEDVGVRTTFAIQSTEIQPLDFIETWMIEADLTSTDETVVGRVDESSFTVSTQNRTARSATITTPLGTETFDVGLANATEPIEHSVGSEHWSIITVHDADQQPIHRSVTWVLSGLEVSTELGQGDHRIAMVNHGRAERFGDDTWDLQQTPLVHLDTLVDGEVRLTMALRDVTTSGNIGSGRVPLDFVSLGGMTVFSGEVWNLRFTMRNVVDQIVTPQIHDAWLTDYTLNRAAGTLNEHVGISPWQRASGMDGFTVNTAGAPLQFELDVSRIEVRR